MVDIFKYTLHQHDIIRSIYYLFNYTEFLPIFPTLSFLYSSANFILSS